MASSKIAVPLVAAALAGAIGFYCGMRYAYSRMALAMIGSVVSESQPDATPSWEISDNKDAMTDKKSVWLELKSTTSPQATLQLSCYPSIDVSIYSDHFYDQSDDYYVTYRIDQKPAISMDRWHSVTHFASPPDTDKFISELSGGRKLIVDISTPRVSTDRYVFDIAGYDQKFSEFQARCSKLQTPLPAPVAES